MNGLASFCRCVSLSLLALAMTGCGGGTERQLETGAVSGVVQFNGQPVSEGTVVFSPAGEGVAAEAKIGADGKYSATTQYGGLPLGDYKISILPPTVITPDTADSPGGEEFKKVDNIPQKYRSADTSGFTLTVTKQGQVYDMEMTP